MGKRHVRNRLDFRHLEYSKIGSPLVESIQRIMIRADVLGQALPAHRSMNIPHSATPSTMPPWTPTPMTRRVNWSITTRTQCVFKVADSHRNKSQLHKLSFMWPRNVSQDGPPESDSG